MLRFVRAFFLIFFACAASSAQTQPAAEIDARELDGIYKRELGERYEAKNFDNLLNAHRQIERYFTATSAERDAFVKTLRDSGIDANILGRITRILLNWPKLRCSA